ncbi:MAG TPA: 4'-phosphopantetheinyl transferase superfamily protein [Bacteroidia bacterium]
MACLVKKKSGKGGLVGIWTLEGGEEEYFSRASLPPQDHERFTRLAVPQKRAQWAAVRMLLADMYGDDSLHIVYDEHNKPSLLNSPLKISISHSYDKVAVILQEEYETGIDIERIKSKVEHIAAKFMSDEELGNLGEAHRIEQLYVHWCVKESLYKLYGKKELLFREHLFVEPFVYKGSGMVRGNISIGGRNETYELFYERSGEHMLSYVVYQ